MRWSRDGANALLQVRCAVINDDDVRNFKRWYPSAEARLATVELAAYCPRFWPLPIPHNPFRQSAVASSGSRQLEKATQQKLR